VALGLKTADFADHIELILNTFLNLANCGVHATHLAMLQINEVILTFVIHNFSFSLRFLWDL
jgi:hypothetical protein